MKKLQLLTILFISSLSLTYAHAETENHQRNQQQKKNKVFLFTQTYCPSCIYAKQYMEKENIDFIELDIETNENALNAFERLNGRGTPMMVLNKQIRYGFDVEFLKANLYDNN